MPVRTGGEWLGSVWAVVEGEVPHDRVAQVRVAVDVVALHLLLAAWQHRRSPRRDLPAQMPHLVLALAWGALLLAVLQAVRSLVFDDALANSSFLAPQAVVIAAVFALLTGFVLHRGLVTPWVARRVDLSVLSKT